MQLSRPLYEYTELGGEGEERKQVLLRFYLRDMVMFSVASSTNRRTGECHNRWNHASHRENHRRMHQGRITITSDPSHKGSQRIGRDPLNQEEDHDLYQIAR